MSKKPPFDPKNMPGKPPKPEFNIGILKRVLKMLKDFYPVMLPLAIGCIIFVSITATLPAIFQQQVIAAIEDWYLTGDWAGASKVIIPKVAILGTFYVFSIIAVTVQSQLMTFMTQGFLNKTRQRMFNGMQNLPIKYFDTNKHGDIMSHYTNDIDTLRMLISQAMPTLIQSAIVIVCVLGIMLYYSIWMTLVVLTGVAIMFVVSGKVTAGSAKYFIKQQMSIGQTEGFIQEMMSGQKVVKVFCHEEKSQEDFDRINNQLFEDAYKAHSYANCLGPIIQNIGNILYVIVATRSEGAHV